MALRRHAPTFGVFSALLLAAGSAFALTPSSHQHLEFPLAYNASPLSTGRAAIESVAETRSLAVGGGWTIEKNRITGTVRMAYGGDLRASGGRIASEQQAADAAVGVLDMASELLNTRSNNSRLRNIATMPGKWAVHFDQIVNGLRVHTGESFVLLSDEGQVIAFGSDFFDDHDAPDAPSLSSQQAIDAAAHSIGAVPMTDKPTTADLLYVPALGEEVYELKIAYRVEFQSQTPFGRWETFVDAATGQILSRRNFFHTVNVIGTSQGDVEDFGYCDGTATLPFENQTVNVTGGNNDVTDDAGAFVITHAGATPVTVTSQFLGPFINVNRSSGLGTDASFSGPATPGTPLTINWTNGNSRADERDSFFHGNRSHDFMKAIDPSFNGLDYAMPTTIGLTTGFCPGNAWWDGNGMNYCRETATYGNTGQIGNVVYHEYGHGVTQEVYQAAGAPEPSSDLHEGNSDVLANLIDRQPIIGLGFFLNDCDSGIRDSDNNLQWPQDVNGQEGHFAGQVIAGFVWDSWQSMLGAMPQAEADSIIRRVWHLSRVMGTPNNPDGQKEQVDWSFLVDDDDANLDNGTPHHDHLCLGASNHGFPCPEILVGVIIVHTPHGHTEDGSSLSIDAIITSTEAALDPASLQVHYRLNGGSFVDLTMTPTGNPDEYAAALPALGDHSEVEYYISAADLASNTRTSPATAPAQLHAFDVAHVYATLESGSAGWTIGQPGDNATTGIWTLVDPIGTAAQPEDDATPAPGVNAFITGQCSGGNCPSGCDLGCNDVDGGTTTLLSPIFDVTGATQAKIKYERWYTNNTGAEPNTDFWVVDVSNNGGTTWTNIENTNVSAGSWSTRFADIDALFGTPGQVRLRFRASDLLAGSLVEAAIDEIRVLAEFGAVGVEDLVAVAPATLSLEQNQPNPFSPMTRIDFAVPAKGDVKLSVYDVSGREVKSLSSGMREAGRYSVQWNGKDTSGAKVAAGVYFYRLTSDTGTLTRKMTVLK